jgi:hypothetical protein
LGAFILVVLLSYLLHLVMNKVNENILFPKEKITIA